ncbi:MAG TPA: universal stress protein [Terriglobales bacterium]|nr:universal stress protein [Terriglobales bacterium]
MELDACIDKVRPLDDNSPNRMTKTPEQWLEEAAPVAKKSGLFKLFLGYAPGVGKTHTMLTEAIRRKSRGEDVVIGVVETHGRKAVGELVQQLEIVPRKAIEYKGAQFEEMDVDAILARHPRVALIDELAHTNIEGSKHRKRYEDVFELLDAGIDVLSTMNIQHLESVTPTVQGVTGIQVRETVPDWVLQRVNEVVMIDLTPEALQNRMRRGDVYPQERVGRALENFFRETNLIALRELALRQVAQAVDLSLEQRREILEKDKTAVPIRERIAVCISSNPAAQYLIARGARMAQAMNADLFVVYTDMGQDTSEENQRTLNANLRFAENVAAKIVRVKGKSIAQAVAEFVNEKHITQVVFGRSATRGWKRYFYLSAIHQFLRDAPAVDVHIVTQERDEQ